MGQPGKNTGFYGVKIACGPTPARKQQKPKGNPGGSYSNTTRQKKISYTDIPAATIFTTTEGNATLTEGASMKTEHKTIPDGSGAGKSWIFAQQLRKANWVMDPQDSWKHQQ